MGKTYREDDEHAKKYGKEKGKKKKREKEDEFDRLIKEVEEHIKGKIK